MKSCLGLAILAIIVLIASWAAQVGTFGAASKHSVEKTMMQPLPEVYGALDQYLTGATFEGADDRIYSEGSVTAHMVRTANKRLILTLRSPKEILLEIDAELEAGAAPGDTKVKIRYTGAQLAYRLKIGVETKWLEELIGRHIDGALSAIASDTIPSSTFSIRSIIDRSIAGRSGQRR